MEENRRKGVAKRVIQRNRKGKWLRIDSGFSGTAKRSVTGSSLSSGWFWKACQQFLSVDGDTFFYGFSISRCVLMHPVQIFLYPHLLFEITKMPHLIFYHFKKFFQNMF